MLARSQKYVEYTRAFHYLERFLFCEGGTNKKTHFKSLSWTLRKTLHDPSQAEMQLVKIENLYRNLFTQVPVTGVELIQDYHGPQQDWV